MSDPTAGGRADLVSRILGYIDRPWKAMAVAGLAILAGAGWLIWTERARLAEAFLPAQHHAARLKSAETIAPALADLVALDDTALVMVWSVDIRANAVRFIAATARDHAPWTPEDHDLPDRLPAMIDTTSAAGMVALLQGEAQCADTVRLVGLLPAQLAADGLARVCVVPVPPIYGKVLGVLILAWRGPSAGGVEDAAVAAATEAALAMATR